MAFVGGFSYSASCLVGEHLSHDHIPIIPRRSGEVSELLSFQQVMDRFPDPKPCPRSLREQMDRLSLRVKLGQQSYMQARHWDALIEGIRCRSSSANGDVSGTLEARCRPARRPVKSSESVSKKAVELSRKLERVKSPPTSKDTTTIWHMEGYKNMAPLLPKPR